MEITPEECEAIGCQRIHWNPKYHGGFFEFYLPLTGDGRDIRDSRLSVSFGDTLPDYPFMVWIVMPNYKYGCKHVKTIEQFKQLYYLLSGRILGA